MAKLKDVELKNEDLNYFFRGEKNEKCPIRYKDVVLGYIQKNEGSLDVELVDDHIDLFKGILDLNNKDGRLSEKVNIESSCYSFISRLLELAYLEDYWLANSKDGEFVLLVGTSVSSGEKEFLLVAPETPLNHPNIMNNYRSVEIYADRNYFSE